MEVDGVEGEEARGGEGGGEEGAEVGANVGGGGEGDLQLERGQCVASVGLLSFLTRACGKRAHGSVWRGKLGAKCLDARVVMGTARIRGSLRTSYELIVLNQSCGSSLSCLLFRQR